MAERKIINHAEDDILRKRSKEITNFDGRLHMLIDDMRDTMESANGVGLAAVQVGALRRVVVMSLGEDGKVLEAVNPEITSTEGEETYIEGCLSVPGYSGNVTRPAKVILKAQDRFGKKYKRTLYELDARIACHEIDHLDGKLFIDVATDVKKLEDSE